MASSTSERALPNEVCDQLRRAIVGGTLRPGDRIVEARLARELGISRGPIREAARLLEREGLLVSHPGRGFAVRQITLRELQEIYDVRACIECFAVRRAVEGRGAALVAALESIVERLMDATRSGAFSEQVAADFEFHRTIVAAAGNERLLRTYDGIAGELRMALSLTGSTADAAEWREIMVSHTGLIEAIRTAVPDEAERKVRAHIAAAWNETLVRLMATLGVGPGLAPDHGDGRPAIPR